MRDTCSHGLWPRSGAGCSGNFPRSIAPTTGREACRPLAGHCFCSAHDKVRRRGQGPGRLRHPVESALLRWRTGPSPRARLFRAQLILQTRCGKIRVQPAAGPGVGVPEKAEHEGGAGHDQHPGSGQGHLQPVGGRVVKLMRALAAVEQTAVKVGPGPGIERYLGSSVKRGHPTGRTVKRGRPPGIVADADRLLELSRQAQGDLPEDSAERQRIVTEAELLGQLLSRPFQRKSGDWRRRREPQGRGESGPDDVGARPGDAPRSQEQQQTV